MNADLIPVKPVFFFATGFFVLAVALLSFVSILLN